MRPRHAATALGLGIALLGLSACDPAAPPPVTPSASAPAPSASSSPAPPAPTLDADALLAVTATLTADNGAVLDLVMQVHRAVAWSDPAAAPLATAMTTQCAGALDESVYEANLWTFLRVDVAATGRAGTPAWPADSAVTVHPGPATGYTLASDGFLLEDPGADPASPHCVRQRLVSAAGSGTLVVGIEGDTDEVGAAGAFTRWANTSYGVSGDATISDCVVTVTEAGTALNGGGAWWSETVDAGTCLVGGAP